MDPITALFVALAAVLTATGGIYATRRSTPDRDEGKMDRSIDRLESMIDQYEKDRVRFLQELERERGKVETLEHELEEERARAKSIIDAKQLQVDESLRKIAILEHQKAQAEEQIQELRTHLRKHIPRGGAGGASA
jgi:predicted RNase H-like nuclease (RuvC/YqgF family)